MEDFNREENENTYEKMKYVNYQSFYDKEYGIYHFKIPNPLLRKASFDCSGETILWNKSISLQYNIFYRPIPEPGKNDWLMNHKEYGQTFNEYKRFGFHPIERIQINKNETLDKDIIYIAPLSFNLNPSFDQSFLTAIILLCQSYFYDMKIKLLNMKINLEGVEYRNYEDGSYQMNANTIIEKLFHEMPKNGYCLICLTDMDLYNDVRVIKPRKWIYYPPPYKNDFCYELNSFKYWVSICSIARFDPNFIMEKKSENEEEKIKLYFILLKRICKVVIKNISHMFGLKNCIFFSCIMNGFGSIKEFDSRPMELCPCCLRKVFTNIARKFNKLNDEGRVKNDGLIIKRYKKLKKCLEKNFVGIFEKEEKWYEDRIKVFKQEIIDARDDEEEDYDD